MRCYANAIDNGIFFELDLENLKVIRTLETGWAPVQGSVINNVGQVLEHPKRTIKGRLSLRVTSAQPFYWMDFDHILTKQESSAS